MIARPNTDKLLSMLTNGELDENTVIDACLRYMSDDDVGDMMKHNEFEPDTGYDCDQCGESIAEDEDHVHRMYRYCEECYKTVGKPKEGRCWYDLDPQGSVLYAVEGPEGYKIEDIDYENLPEDFEYVTDERWEWFARYAHIVSLFPDGLVEHRGFGEGLGKTLHNLFEMGGME